MNGKGKIIFGDGPLVYEGDFVDGIKEGD